MSLRLKPRFSVYQFSIHLRGFQPTVWRRVQLKDCLLIDLHRAILAAFGVEDEHNFRFSRWLGDYLDSGERFQRLPPETWLSQLAPLDGRELVLRHRFGDVNTWRFMLVYEGCVLSAYDTQYPLCVDGERADVPRGMLPFFFDSYLAFNASDADWRALGMERPAAADPARFDLAGVNARLERLGDHGPCHERHSSCSLRVELSQAEMRLVAEHGSLEPDEARSISSGASRDALCVYLPEAMALARNLAVAANRVGPGPLQRGLERLAGRFQRHVYDWLALDREIHKSLA